MPDSNQRSPILVETAGSVPEPYQPGGSREMFAQAVLRDPDVRRALAGDRWRLLHIQSFDELDKSGENDVIRECAATIYNYSANQALIVRGAPDGRGPLRMQGSTEQPKPSPDEIGAAVRLVEAHPVWGPMLRAGQVQPYTPMPPMLEGPPGEVVERIVYVGLGSRPRQFNRVVAVNMTRGEVSPGSVRLSRVADGSTLCGPQEALCNRPPRPTAGYGNFSWPATKPVWKFEAIRPAASTGFWGSGIELRNVKYKGHSVLKQAHVPILNIEYDQDLCGPFRDWLYEETCFTANGSDLASAPGFRMCTEPPVTAADNDVDGGEFVGVAIWEDPDGSLRMESQCWAGWYRYISEWQFYPDGTLLPRLRFAYTMADCICYLRTHHIFWRFDFDVMKTNNIVEQQNGTAWDAFKKETSITRPAGETVVWRVREANGKAAYTLTSGANDGVADAFSGPDQFVLRWHANEVDDTDNGRIDNAPANIQQWVNGESVYEKDDVVWYAAHLTNPGDPAGTVFQPVEVGPTLQPQNWPK